MIRKLIGTMAIAAVLAVPARHASAQVSLGYTDVGGVIGIGNLGGANISFGGRFETIFKDLPELGNGLLGIGVSADFYSWSSSYYSIKYIPIGVTGNYHFKLENKKFDAFVGAGLGYTAVTCSQTFTYNLGCGYSSGVYAIARAGGRYFISSNLAFYADVGAGAALANGGITFKIK